MTVPFNPNSRLIIVTAELDGPRRKTKLRLALDTGSSRTSVNRWVLHSLGYDPDESTIRYRMTTSSGVEYVPSVNVVRFSALGHEQLDIPVICHSLPATATIDGLLGLDFLRSHELTIDFRHGLITLT